MSKDVFEKNIANTYGLAGKNWLKQLRDTIRNLARHYRLSELTPVQNLSYNYVMSGLKSNKPVILKIGFDKEALKRETEALKAFAGFGAVQVIIEDEGVLILEKAIPGNSLKSYLPSKSDEAIRIACATMKRLHHAPTPSTAKFPHIKDWLSTLDKDWELPMHYLQKARQLKATLLQKNTNEVLLHGDLHHDNILENGGQWLVIDPKGVIGGPINEAWAFVIDIENDTKFIADFFGFQLQDVRDWYFVHLALAACWNLEDNTDPSLFIKLMEKAYHITSQ